MILSANQPYFCAFPGFFHKALASDVLIMLDDVQFPRGTTWITRNRFKNDRGVFWITVPVRKKGLGLQRISQVRICHEGRWRHKHLESIKAAYANAPYLGDHIGFMTEVFSNAFEKIIDLNLAVTRYLMKNLQVETKLRLLSELDVTGKGTELLLEICRAAGATVFLAQRQAGRFLDAKIFQRNGIELRYITCVPPVYPQLWGDFLANLSTFDLLFNCGPGARDILLRHRPAAGR